MPSACLLKTRIWKGVSFLATISFLLPSQVQALTAHQTCSEGSLCTIGEFVYTDSAVAITDATCQFTSFTPSGTSFVSAAPLTGTADGWYAYSFTPDGSTAVGTYPTQICCQTTENDLCIDKTFEITDASSSLTTDDVAGAVWNATMSGYTQSGSFGEKVDSLENNTLSASDIWSYSGRTLSNFGSLISDIWNYATRSLTDTQNIADSVWNAETADYTTPGTFGQDVNQSTNLTAQDVWEYTDRDITNSDTVAESVWDYQNRSLTSFGNLVSSVWSADNRTATDPNGATSTQIAALNQEIKNAQDLIQQLINSGATSTSTSDTQDYSALLDEKLATTKDYLSQIQNNLEIISTKLGLLALKWDQLSDTDRTQELQDILALLGSSDSTDLDTLIGQIGWFADNWPKSSTTTLLQNFNTLSTDISDFINTIQVSPSDDTQAAIINQLFATASSLKVDIGDISQSEVSPSLYGQYKTNKLLVEALNNQLRIINSTITDWDRLSLADRDATIQSIAAEVTNLNRFSALKILLTPQSSTPEYLHNLKAVVQANQAALAASQNPVTFTWIGGNATTYNAFTYNPSKSKTQTAPIQFLLPQEITLDDLSNVPTNLSATFNPDKNAIEITGSHQLDPNAHMLDTIFANDIWQIDQADVDQLRLQTASLLSQLEKSPLYPQASELATTINAALDTILSLQSITNTPEAKIQSFRQIQSLKAAVDQNLSELQNLVNTADDTSSLKGFIGGVQAVAVWAMIVIVIAGFIFLSLYMRALYGTTQVASDNLNLPLAGPTPAAKPALPRFHLPFAMPNLEFLDSKRFTISFTLLSLVLLGFMTTKRSSTPIAPTNQAPAVQQQTPSADSNQALPLAPLEPAPVATPASDINTTPESSPAATILLSPPDLESTLNLYHLPTVTSSISTTINAEETATIVSQANDWVEVTLIHHDPQITGWVNKTEALILPF